MDTISLLAFLFSAVAVFVTIGGVVVSSAKYQEKVDNSNEKLKDVDIKLTEKFKDVDIKLNEKFTTFESRIAENKAQFNADLSVIKTEYKELKDSADQRQNLYTEKFTRLEITMENILQVMKDVKDHLKK